WFLRLEYIKLIEENNFSTEAEFIQIENILCATKDSSDAIPETPPQKSLID
ncbi:18327_t:CDS:1, partial [Dentiscutata erythropus]